MFPNYHTNCNIIRQF